MTCHICYTHCRMPEGKRGHSATTTWRNAYFVRSVLAGLGLSFPSQTRNTYMCSRGGCLIALARLQYVWPVYWCSGKSLYRISRESSVRDGRPEKAGEGSAQTNKWCSCDGNPIYCSPKVTPRKFVCSSPAWERQGIRSNCSNYGEALTYHAGFWCMHLTQGPCEGMFTGSMEAVAETLVRRVPMNRC